MELLKILKFSLLVSLINLDERNLGSFTISRPIVSGLIFGLIFNNIFLGLYVGTLIEMIIVNLMPVGNFIAPNGAIITGIVMYISHYFFMQNFEFIFPIILLYGLVFGHISKRILRILWVLDNSLVEKFIKKVRTGKIHFTIFNFISLSISLFVFMVSSFVSIYLGIFIINYLSESLVNNFIAKNILKFISDYLPLFALVYFLSLYDVPHKIWFILLGVFSTALLHLLLKNNFTLIFGIIILIFTIVIFSRETLSTKLKLQ